MKNNFTFGIIVLLIFLITSCDHKNQYFKFYSCKFDSSGSVDSVYFSKWIDSKEDASKAKLTFDSNLNKRNLDSLYKETGQYLFVIGGGGTYINPDDCTAEIKNDSILISYKFSGTYAPVGESASSWICLESTEKNILVIKT